MPQECGIDDLRSFDHIRGFLAMSFTYTYLSVLRLVSLRYDFRIILTGYVRLPFENQPTRTPC